MNGRQRDHVILVKPSPMDNFNASKGGTFVPLGPLYLAESLQRHGYRVTILDEGNDETLRRVDELVGDDTLCIGISTMSGTQLQNAILLTRELRDRYSDIPVIWGGVHVTALPRETLESGIVDLLVWGEGEESFPRLLELLQQDNRKAFHQVNGIGFVDDDGEIVITPSSGYTSLKRSFQLPYELVDMKRYSRNLIVGAEKEMPIWTSRGCPFNCRFCSNNSTSWLNTRVRYHTTEHIVEDVKRLVDRYGADMITFADEGFLFSVDRFLNLLEAIREAGVKVKYRFSTRVDLITRIKPEQWDRLLEYGLVAVGAG
ncbi:radical SAM protein, partial [bacterium]|nr:radical SAM protein [bacterium]